MRMIQRQKGEMDSGILGFFMFVLVVGVIALIVVAVNLKQTASNLEDRLAVNEKFLEHYRSNAKKVLVESSQSHSAEVSVPSSIPAPSETTFFQEEAKEIWEKYLEECLQEAKIAENVAYIPIYVEFKKPSEIELNNELPIRLLARFQKKYGVQITAWSFDSRENHLCVTFFKPKD